MERQRYIRNMEIKSLEIRHPLDRGEMEKRSEPREFR